jgi:hypothetical protein
MSFAEEGGSGEVAPLGPHGVVYQDGKPLTAAFVEHLLVHCFIVGGEDDEGVAFQVSLAVLPGNVV